MVKERIDPLRYRTAELRRDWAIRKARELAKRRAELESGAPRTTGTTIVDGIAKYYAEHPHLRTKTVVTYKHGTDRFLAWAAANRLTSLDDVRRGHLQSFRSAVIAEPNTRNAKHGKRGERQAGDKPRSPFSVNRDLAAVRGVLSWLRDCDLLPRVSGDDLRRSFKRIKAAVETISFMQSHECQQLLQSALRHDAEAGRYRPIGPFLATALLTGMRRGELIELTWSNVDLEAKDEHGRRVGEIRVRGATNKTHRARTVDLSVSPVLAQLLAALRLRSGGNGRVFPMSVGEVIASGLRLVREFGAPATFSWQACRRTCGTVLSNASGIFGGSSAYRSARQLGHATAVAERHYLGVLRGIPREAQTIEAALQIESELRQIIERVSTPHAASPATVGAVRDPRSSAS